MFEFQNFGFGIFICESWSKACFGVEHLADGGGAWRVAFVWRNRTGADRTERLKREVCWRLLL